MKEGKKTALWILAALLGTGVFLGIGFWATADLWDREGIVDAKDSPGGRYCVSLYTQAPSPFQERPMGRVTLRQGRRKLAEYEFILPHGEKAASPDMWAVSWKRERVEIYLFRKEQSDLLAEFFFDGGVRVSLLSRTAGEEGDGPPGVNHPSDSGASAETALSSDGILPGSGTLSQADQHSVGGAGEDNADAAETVSPERETEQRILDGYEAVRKGLSDAHEGGFQMEYDAKGNSRVYVYEDSTQVRYLVYNRPSQNGLCGLYVYYSSRKDENGSWSPMDASILAMYAYVYETGEVIDSGKTHWEDTGSEAYRNAAGEP